MLYGSIKLANFFEDNQNAIFGALKGTVTGGVIGATKDLGEHKSIGKRLKSIGSGALIGTGLGALGGHYLDDNKEEIKDFVNEKVMWIDDVLKEKGI